LEAQRELQERLAELQLQKAESIERKPAEKLQEGDRVFVDIVTYIDGRIAMFWNEENLPLYLEPGTLVPGFTETLLNASVGSRLLILSAFPEDYPEHSLRGRNFSMSVFVRAAEELKFPDETVGTNSDLTKQILDQIVEEHGLAYRLKAVNLALEKLAEKALPVVSEDQLDAVLKAEWFRKQGKFLLTQQVPQEDREEAMKQWLLNSELREEMRRRLAVTLAVRTVARRYGLLNPSEQEFRNYVQGICEGMGLSLDEANDSLSKDRQTRNAIHEQFVYSRTVDFIAENVQMVFQSN
jgi:trigger factor